MDGPSIPYGFTSDKADEFLQVSFDKNHISLDSKEF